MIFDVYYVLGGGIDYDTGPYTIMFPAGVTSVQFSFSIYDDAIFEDDKYFTLTIDPSSTPNGVSVGQARVNIVDDDRE